MPFSSVPNSNSSPIESSKMSEILGVVVLARNGDRTAYYQDPSSYSGSATETTALGEADSHQLGALLRSTYFSSSSPSFIKGISSEIVDNNEVKVRVKAGGEGTVVFDSAIALLQGLFPPNPNNKIVLANETTVVAPLGGYQYVPVETVEPGNDRSLESWTDCPAFQQHVAEFHASDAFKAKAKEAAGFYASVKDFVFGRPTTLENSWNIFDFVNTQLTHNKTYAHRLPPTFVEQARGYANWHESGVFSDEQINGIGNIAGRTVLHAIISSLERIAFNGDPLQFLLIQTTYQPFISLLHQFEVIKDHPELKAIPDYSSALAIELRRGPPPESRDFIRLKFKNGTAGAWEVLHVFGHHADIPVTEFIYRAENAAITSNKEWRQVCSGKSVGLLEAATGNTIQSAFTGAFAFVLLLGLFAVSKMIKNSRAKARASRVRLEGGENVPVVVVEKTRYV
ncbi:Histidine phosphatase superfamily protein [Pleurotus pulmonarius]